jgi:uncharacterized DUF497 family protein
MIDFDRIDGFEWDGGNRRKSEDKHDVTPAEAEQVFFNRPLLILDDAMHSLAEPRYLALGRTDDGRRLFIVFTIRRNGTKLRVISARDMHRKERARYASED